LVVILSSGITKQKTPNHQIPQPKAKTGRPTTPYKEASKKVQQRRLQQLRKEIEGTFSM
jgi:hypothetical protein